MKKIFCLKSLFSLLLLFIGMNVFATDEENTQAYKYITWDLSIDETTTATSKEMSWVNTACTVIAKKGNASTNTNNYYPGTCDNKGNYYTSTRFYAGSTLTFTPAPGVTISSIIYTATTSTYASQMENSKWTNMADTVINDKTTVIITPQDGTKAITVELNYTSGGTKLVVKYTGNPTSYTRSTSKDKFGTICLPYAFTTTDAKVYTAAFNSNKNGVTLTEVIGTTVAGTPYIYYATGDEGQTFTLSGEASTNPVPASPLTGIFTPKELAAGDYVMQTLNDTQAFYLVKSGSEPRLSPYKAYILAANVPSNGEGKAINIDTEGETEGINALNALVNGEAKIYDLSGRQLKTLQKGINIVNGVKVIVK